MKKIFLLLSLISFTMYSQYSVKGVIIPSTKQESVLLYKIKGAAQKYVNSSKIIIDTIKVNGDKKKVGKFSFSLPKDSIGSYRIVYTNSGAGFLDFVFNNENVEMNFNPQYPEESVFFSESKENKLYREYIQATGLTQTTLDSIQVSYIELRKDSSLKDYAEAKKNIERIQNYYEKNSKGMMVHDFIKSSRIFNTKEPQGTTNAYMKSVVDNFFNHVDFANKNLINSPFLIDKITYYIKYLNVSDSSALQKRLYIESIEKVMKMLTSNLQTKQISEYLVSVFTQERNSEVVDFIFEKYYNKLPKELVDNEFKKRKLSLLKASVGRIAPDFSWKENGKSYKLSTINDGEKYLLVFWSTLCSHCVKEIPELYEYMKKHKDVSVIAFAIEDNDLDFNNWSKNKLYNWHNVLGTHPDNRFENKSVIDYLIDATPTYFILDKNKKIISTPYALKDVKEYLEKK